MRSGMDHDRYMMQKNELPLPLQQNQEFDQIVGVLRLTEWKIIAPDVPFKIPVIPIVLESPIRPPE